MYLIVLLVCVSLLVRDTGIRDIKLYSSFDVCVWPQGMSWDVLSPLYFGIKFSLNVWQNPAMKPGFSFVQSF